LGEEEDGDGGADEGVGEDGGEGHDVGVLELWVFGRWVSLWVWPAEYVCCQR
jgi:hypothetical protein